MEQFEPETIRALVALKASGATSHQGGFAALTFRSSLPPQQAATSNNGGRSADVPGPPQTKRFRHDTADITRNYPRGIIMAGIEEVALVRILAGVPDLATNKRLIDYYLR